jgi:hypothetical protein
MVYTEATVLRSVEIYEKYDKSLTTKNALRQGYTKYCILNIKERNFGATQKKMV